MRQLLVKCLAVCLVALGALNEANAIDLPIRKAGLWEMKVAGDLPTIVWRGQRDIDRPSLRSMREMIFQHCTDETIDKEMSSNYFPRTKNFCSKQEVQKTATGFVIDSICGDAGASVTSHSEFTGDFNSAYTVKSILQSEGGPARTPRETLIEARWLGACLPDQTPGDVLMPGGFKINAKDIARVKNQGNMYIRTKPAP